MLSVIWSTGHGSPAVGHWKTKDGGQRLIAWSNKPVPAIAAAPAYLVTSGIDSTEREQSADGARSPTIRSRSRRGRPPGAGAACAPARGNARRLRGDLERVFAAVSAECARALDGDASFVWRFEGDDTATIVGRYNRFGLESFPVGTRMFADGETTSIGRVRESGGPACGSTTGASSAVVRRAGMLKTGYRSTHRSADRRRRHALGAGRNRERAEPLPPGAEARLAAFCDLVSPAVASAGPRGPADLARPHRPKPATSSGGGRAQPARRRAAAASSRRRSCSGSRRCSWSRTSPPAAS